MATPGWYNENGNRAYPFLAGSVGVNTAPGVGHLPDSAIVDAGFVMGLESGFDAALHHVWLDHISRVENIIRFVFRTDAPGCATQTLIFARDLTDPTSYLTEYVDNYNPAVIAGAGSGYSLSLFEGSGYSGTCDPEPLWSGFLVTGDLAPLAALRFDGMTWLATGEQGTVEPGLIHNQDGSYVADFNLANQDRTRITAPAGCPPLIWPYPTGPDIIFVAGRCLRGDVRFAAGYNATIRQDNTANAIILGASVGAGLGQPCDELPLFPGERPPAPGRKLDGSLPCNRVIRSLNGRGGTLLTVLGGLGVDITPVPLEHKIVVNVDMARLSVCFSAVSQTV